MDQKLTGWSDRLSNLLDFLPKMDAALWALIGITGETTFVSSLLVQTSANAGQGEQSSHAANARGLQSGSERCRPR
jgi:hypothetical protein